MLEAVSMCSIAFYPGPEGTTNVLPLSKGAIGDHVVARIVEVVFGDYRILSEISCATCLQRDPGSRGCPDETVRAGAFVAMCERMCGADWREGLGKGRREAFDAISTARNCGSYTPLSGWKHVLLCMIEHTMVDLKSHWDIPQYSVIAEDLVSIVSDFPDAG